ncbi:MAG TPA: acyl-CoA synthetase [Acidimicrobiales bacterium]
MPYNIADLFEHAVDAVPDRLALVVDDQRRTYRELDADANRFAHHLRDVGIGPGDHVGIYGANSLEWLVAMLAAFKLRAVPINVNYRYVEDELRYLLDNADVKAVVVDRGLAPRLANVRGDLPLIGHVVVVDDGSDGGAGGAGAAGADAVVWADAVAGASPERDFGPRSPDDHYVLYTGGTTGMPKGVVWRQEDVFMALGGGIDAYTQQPVSSETELAEKAAATETPLVSYCLPPLMHGAAQWATMRFLFDGSTTVLARRFDPHDAWRTIARERVNSTMITGDAMGRPLIEALDDLADEDLDLSSLVVIASSAAVFSPAVKDRFLARFPDLILVDAIGSTETGSTGMAMASPGAEMRGGPTVQPGRDAVVLDDDLREMPPGTGKVGRMARKGNIPLGYYKDEAKTRETFVTGPDGVRYVLAGDMAVREADGSITLLGRGSGCINTGGEKVFPEEVEGVLKAHPAVFDTLVVGVPDERWGQRVAAVVQPRPGATVTLAELDEHCRARLAAYKVPRQLTVVDAITRSPSGKPDYPWAQRVAREAAEAQAADGAAGEPAGSGRAPASR